jgi:DMSO/TMAO reductase YedYZ molybdopterin-dependent catalytic subunit
MRVFAAAALVAAVGAIGLAVMPGSAVVTRPALAAATPQASPAADEALEILGLVDRPGTLGLAALRVLPTETVHVTYEANRGAESHDFTGVRLYDVLQHVGIVAEPGDRTPLLRRYLVITAKDGYRLVVSGGELDPDFGNVPMLLAWERDGQPLTGDEGPLELVAPGDRLVSRYVYGVVQIDVEGIESAPETEG